MRRKTKKADTKRNAPTVTRIQSAHKEPVSTIERVLTRPDGSTVKVRVPVYPPFELKTNAKSVPGKARKTG